MDIIILLILVPSSILLDLLALKYRASLFSVMSSMMILYSEAQMISSGHLTNGAFIFPTTDYAVSVVILVMFITLPIAITMGAWKDS